MKEQAFSISNVRIQDRGKRNAHAENAFIQRTVALWLPQNGVRAWGQRGASPSPTLQGGRELPQEGGGQENSITHGICRENILPSALITSLKFFQR